MPHCRLLVLSSLLACPAAAFAQAAPPADSFKLDFEPSKDGATLLKVLAPEGAQVKVMDGKTIVHEDDIPTSFAVRPDAFYRVTVRLQDGRTWEKKLSGKRGQVGSLTVIAAAFTTTTAAAPRAACDCAQIEAQVVSLQAQLAAGQQKPAASPAFVVPRAMAAADFAALKASIAKEDFAPKKLDALQSGIGNAWFSMAQVCELVDLVVFEQDKVKVVVVTREHILDPSSAPSLLTHFQFDSDKKQVKLLLGQQP